ALVWMPPIGELKRYPNLKAIFSIGAGCDHILRDPDVPKDLPIVRLVDDVSVRDMSHYAVHWALHFQRNFDLYAEQQRNGKWQRHTYRDVSEHQVGVLGLGGMGTPIARQFVSLGFKVSGWSRTLKSVDGVQCYAGLDELPDILGSSSIIVSVLPLTSETDGLLNRNRFAKMLKGSFIINIGRGPVINDTDLIAALDSGQIAAAALDVFAVEPLPSEHPYWTHPRVFVTPHAAGPTQDISAIEQIVSNIQKLEDGEAPHPVWNWDLGY
ncbi:MAG: 2-hydroxyacid dehydrogenase, partial [Hyphomicrobiaceae bacterium]